MAFVLASTAIGDLVRAAPRPARVAAVLPSAVYLEVPGLEVPGLEVPGLEVSGRTARHGPGEQRAWIALLARDAVRVPIALVTAAPTAGSPFAHVRVGAVASIGAGGLRLALDGLGGDGLGGDGRCPAGVHRPIRYWDPTVPRLGGALATASAGRRAEALARLAARLPAPDGRDWPALADRLESALAPSGPPAAALADAARDLAGLGPGLTPAGDDVLAGALVALVAAGDEPRRAALAQAVAALLPRTTPISAALLRHACRGRAVPQVGAVLRALAGRGDLDGALAALALVGHTSGAALALGLRAALRARGGRAVGRCA